MSKKGEQSKKEKEGKKKAKPPSRAPPTATKQGAHHQVKAVESKHSVVLSFPHPTLRHYFSTLPSA